MIIGYSSTGDKILVYRFDRDFTNINEYINKVIKNYAKFKALSGTIIRIIDKQTGKSQDEYYDNATHTLYKVNTVINKEIYFYLTLEPAWYQERKNILNGPQKEWTDEGYLLVSLFYHAGLYHGHQIFIDNNDNSVVILHYINGIKNGKEIIISNKNNIQNVYETDYCNNVKHGAKKYYRNNQLIYEEKYNNGILFDYLPLHPLF